jgi:hypothetical protein
MVPSHGFGAASHREVALRGAPASHGETAFRGAEGSVRSAAAMRSTIAKCGAPPPCRPPAIGPPRRAAMRGRPLRNPAGRKRDIAVVTEMQP